MGRLAQDNGSILPMGVEDAPIPKTIAWTLDNLGNWTGNDVQGSGEIRTGFTYPLEYHDHEVNLANQLTQRTAVGNTTDYLYDPNGNMVHDQQYYYQYDAFNRLIQVNEAGSAVVNGDPGDEVPDGKVTSGTFGALVSRFVYDGILRPQLIEQPVDPQMMQGSGGPGLPGRTG